MCAGKGMAAMSEESQAPGNTQPQRAAAMSMESSWSCLFALSLQEHDANSLNEQA